MSGIFISYRREDSAPYAGRLYDRLCAHFGADQVFMDVDDIPPGADFAAHIGAKVASCEAMISVIGKEWLTARNTDGQLRLTDPNDSVGLELSLSLQRGILVIPVLVGGAKIPQGEELRSDLKPLAQRNALTLNDQEFQRDVDQLIQALEKVPGLRKKPVSGGDSWKRELRRRLLRRLAWKAPLIVVLVFFAIWWQWKKESEQPLRTEAQSAAAKSAAAFAGIWSGAITYPWGAKYTEQFFFQPEGDRIFGTAMFLGSKRGIEDGVVVGETVSFRVRFEELMDGVSKVRWNRYEGKIVGSEVLLKVYDDKGNPPVEFKLAKREGFPSAPAPTKP